VSHVFSKLCVIQALLSFGNGVTRNEMRKVGEREKFWGKGKG
jgi:hypothetical protein